MYQCWNLKITQPIHLVGMVCGYFLYIILKRLEHVTHGKLNQHTFIVSYPGTIKGELNVLNVVLLGEFYSNIQYLGSIRFSTTKSTYSPDSPQKTIRFVVLG